MQDLRRTKSNVVDIFSKRPLGEVTNQIVRIAPELDGLEMLYTNDAAPDKIYSLKIACWARKEDGEVFGMVPWLNKLMPCPEINDPLNGRWEGYRDPGIEEIFYAPPKHKIAELEAASDYYRFGEISPDDIIQEIPDAIGTHAVMTRNGFRTFTLVEVFSWRLLANGKIEGMLVDENKVTTTPVLTGDQNCLYSAQSEKSFRYFFQHRIANKIKKQDPEALAAISLLIET